MSLASKTTRRIFGVAVGGAVVGMTMLVAFERIAVRRVLADRMAAQMGATVPAIAAGLCAEGPREPFVDERGTELDFYDERGHPITPGVPSIDARLLRRVRRGDVSVGRFDLSNHEFLALVRLERSAPCAFAQARRPTDLPSVLAFGPLGLFCVTLFAGGLAALLAFVVVGPLVRKLEALRTAATTVGTERFRPLPPWPDEAGEIASALVAAHERIDEDALLLAEKGATFEWLLAELTHDLRTPLSSVQFALDELAEGVDLASLEVLRRALSDVVYMKSLTNNLRLAYRMQSLEGARALLREPIDLADTVTRVLDRARPFGLRRGIDVEGAIVPVPAQSGDPTAVEQALTNLVENAIAHCEPGTKVRVTLEPRSADGARLVVEDDGPGLVPGEVPRLRPGTLGKQTFRARDGKGSGLGLSIAREVCEQSGWTIAFERALPRGLRVVIDTGDPSAPLPTRSGP